MVFEKDRMIKYIGDRLSFMLGRGWLLFEEGYLWGWVFLIRDVF